MVQTDSRGDTVIDRQAAIASYCYNRQRSKEIFGLLVPETYYERPIPLRHPVVFYEGHIPAFAVNTLIRKGLGRDGIDQELERLFARGIDPKDEDAAEESAIHKWPTRDEVQNYATKVDRIIMEALQTENIDRKGHPTLHRGQAVFTVLEHEALHQETLLYMWQRFSYQRKRRPMGAVPIIVGTPPSPTTVIIPSGQATLGARLDEVKFGWDNEFPGQVVQVPAFEIDVHNVTNQDFLEFVESGGYEEPQFWAREDWEPNPGSRPRHPLFWEFVDHGWLWHGMFDAIPLPKAWPVYVSHAEARAYACWKGKRLLTEAEFHRAAYGTPTGEERRYPWGHDIPTKVHGNFDFRHWDPVPVGTHPAGCSAWGVHDLVGNGWEWTSTVFNGFPGFKPMTSYPEYSADFFDGQHYVLKGASSATAASLLRPSFRNWFRSNYPYAYAAFRCAQDSRG